MAEAVARFYDDLASHYHLLLRDWEHSLVWQSECLEGLLAQELGAASFRILDASCGIGTQILGLAARGHHVSGSDLSPAAIARAKREAKVRDLKLSLTVADMRVLTGYHAGPFDAVLIMDNSLAHLRNDEDLAATLAESLALLRPGGLFLTSLRDFEVLAETRPKATAPDVIDDAEGRRVVYQVWDWRSDSLGYRSHIFIQRQTTKDGPVDETLHFATDTWCLGKARLLKLMEAAGFESCRWLTPEESGYYQPIAAGCRGSGS